MYRRVRNLCSRYALMIELMIDNQDGDRQRRGTCRGPPPAPSEALRIFRGWLWETRVVVGDDGRCIGEATCPDRVVGVVGCWRPCSNLDLDWIRRCSKRPSAQIGHTFQQHGEAENIDNITWSGQPLQLQPSATTRT